MTKITIAPSPDGYYQFPSGVIINVVPDGWDDEPWPLVAAMLRILLERAPSEGMRLENHSGLPFRDGDQSAVVHFDELNAWAMRHGLEFVNP